MTLFRYTFARILWIRVAVCGVITLAGLVAFGSTAAAACPATMPTDGGSATFTMSVPGTGAYSVWAHMYTTTETNDAVYMNVDGAHCTLVGNGKLPANQFTWVNYQDGNAASKISFTLDAGQHKFVVAGLDEGVAIDKVMLLSDTTCTPTGDGSNCTPSAQTTTPTTGSTNSSNGNSDKTTSSKTESWLPSSFKQPLAWTGGGLLTLAIGITALWAFKPILLHHAINRLKLLFKKPQPVPPALPVDPFGSSEQAAVISSHIEAPSRPVQAIIFAVVCALVGAAMTIVALASTQSASYLLANATLAGKATLVSNTAAIGGKMVRFSASSTAAATPGGSSGNNSTKPPTQTTQNNTGGGTSSGGGGTSGCAADQVGTPPNCYTAPPFSANSGKKWQVSFSEEFNGTSYDPTKLSPCFDWNYGGCTSSFNQGREHYMPEQIQVSGGTAKLIAAPLSPSYADGACQGGQCTYKAGLLSTARPRADNGSDYLYKFTYGYVESRFKFPATQGFFTAFWMLPADPTYNYRSEIDILELLGDDPTTMFMTYHYNDRNNSYTPNTGKFNNGACPVKNYGADFVRMGVDWEPNRVAWYIDGVKCGEFTDASQIENGPMQIILHMMVDNNWQRSWNVGLQDSNLVRQLEVDYIRVYQQV
jgi:hypothetical protein